MRNVEDLNVTLAALGGGTAETVTAECAAALGRADCIFGAPRLLECLPEGSCTERVAAVRPEDLCRALLARGGRCAVVYSGDTGFYSGARPLLELLRERDIPVRVLPGVSSVQLLAARLCRPWQDWLLISAHGVDCDAVASVLQGRPACFLTSGDGGAAALCRALTDAGLGALPVTVGERLSYPDERVVTGTAASLAGQTFAPLAVVLAEAAPRPARRCAGIADDAFVRGAVPMTKQEVRAAALGKLAVGEGDIFWDIGAGTGSVSVELALAAPRGQVWAVECAPEALALIRENRVRFGAWNLRAVPGRAPEALASLPRPDGAFLGGTKGALAQIVDAVLERNEKARLCIAAVTLETLGAACAALAGHGLEAKVTQIAVSHGRTVGQHHLLTASNPVFLVTGNCDG